MKNGWGKTTMRCGRLAGLLLALAVRVSGETDKTIELDGQTWVATEVVHERFAGADWERRWVLEGNADVEVRDGKLSVATAKTDGVEPAATLWWREPLPAEVMIELTATATGAVEGNAANINLFFHARESDGSPYRFGRSGRYGEYHAFPNYIMTLTGGFQEGWARLRRNPGFTLMHEDGSVRSEVGGTYRIRAVIAGGRLQYWLNDRLIHDLRDSEPLPGGHFALRTWRAHILWSDVRISALRRSERTR